MSVTPPVPATNGIEESCAHLGDVLPAKLEQLQSRVITPKSPLTHAWGKPPILLRCGVPQPGAYDPTSSQTAEVDGVSWFEELTGTGVRWTAIRPGADVELDVPKHYDVSGPYLVDLSGPITRALPGHT